MRKANKEEKKQDSMVIELTNDVRINEDTILEPGDKIEILDKEKVEENKKLKEDDYKKIRNEFANFVEQAGSKGTEYFANDFARLIATAADDISIDVYKEISPIIGDIYDVLKKYK
jgi:hypothetical protein